MTTETLPEHGYGPDREERYTIDGTVYTVHPIARLFPLIEGDDFDALVADVKDRGVRHPVIRRGTVIIDGRNRVRAALACGAKVPFEDLPEFEHPARVILTENIHTRTMTPSQKAALAARIRQMAPGVFELPSVSRRPRVAPADAGAGNAGVGPSKESSAAAPAVGGSSVPAPDTSDKPHEQGKPDPPAAAEAKPEPAASAGGLSRSEVAATVGVSDESARRAERVGEAAPELLDLVSAGDITVRDAYAICEEPRGVRDQAVASLASGTSKTLAQAVKHIKRLEEAAPELRARVFAGKAVLPDAHAICEEPRDVRDKAVAMVGRGTAKTLVEAVRKINAKAGAAGAAGKGDPASGPAGPAPRAPQPRSAGKGEQPALPPLPEVAGPAVGGEASSPPVQPSPSPAASSRAPAPAADASEAAAPPAGGAPAPASSGSSPPSAPSAPVPVDQASASAAAALANVHPDLMTPPVLLSSLRVVLGHIDLDPCSNPDAQDRIAAAEWYSSEQDGPTQRWAGTVWVFPPPSAAPVFAAKLYKDLLSGTVKTAGFFAPADLTAPWASRLLGLASFDALLVEVERGPFEIAGGGPRQQLPVPMAVFLFGIDTRDHAALARSLGVWGRLLVAPTVNRS